MMSEKFDRDCWATPQYLFNWLNSVYNFDVDLCANNDNKKCENYFNEEDNSLKQDWHMQGHKNSGFCNPPYSNIKPWINKAIKETEKGFTTVMLIPTPNGESHYHEIFVHATSITFISGRIAFYNPNLNKHVSGNSRGSCVVEFSKKFNPDLSIQITHIQRDAIKVNYNN